MSVTTTTGSVAAPVEGITTPTEAPAAPAVAAEPTKEVDKFAERLEILSRREKGLYRERQKIEFESKRLAEEKAQYDQWKASKEKAKTNPLDYLTQAGLSYDELTQFMLNGGKPTEQDELKALRDEFRSLKEAQEQKEKQQQEGQTQAQAQAEAQAIEDFKVDISDYLETNKDQFEICHKQGDIGINDVLATINFSYKTKLEAWMKGGRVGRPPGPMSIEEAAKIQEEFYEKELIEYAKMSKIQSKLSPQAEQPGQTAKQPSKTLTNNMASTAASVIPAKNDQDRMTRALAKLGS